MKTLWIGLISGWALTTQCGAPKSKVGAPESNAGHK